MFTYECTRMQSIISYARVLIDMDVTQHMPEEIAITDPCGRIFTQSVEYDWKPQYCTKCAQVGHQCLEMNNRPPPQRPGTFS